jgi:hypothetical protein
LLRRRFLQFRREALEYLSRVHPDLEVRRLTPTGALTSLAGIEVHLDLASMFRRLGGRIGAAGLDNLVQDIRNALPVPVPPPLAFMRARILPMLKHATFVDRYKHYPPGLRPAVAPFADALTLVYAVEGIHHITYVTEGMLEGWRLSIDDLHTEALSNLRRRTRHILEELGGPQNAYRNLDGFDAARILVPELVTPPGIADPIAGIPDEHTLLIAPRAEQERLRAEVEEMFHTAQTPLTPIVFTLQGGPKPLNMLS